MDEEEQLYSLGVLLITELLLETEQQIERLTDLMGCEVSKKDINMHILALMSECYTRNFYLNSDLKYLMVHGNTRKSNYGLEIVIPEETLRSIEASALTRWSSTKQLQEIFNISTALH